LLVASASVQSGRFNYLSCSESPEPEELRNALSTLGGLVKTLAFALDQANRRVVAEHGTS
jgi:hypothetical protein